jgi:hypothetical protein
VDLRARVLLSLQGALIGEVSSVMRGITCDWNESEIRIRCVMDGPVQEEDEESVSVIETRVMADFPDQDVCTECIRLDTPKPLSGAALPGGWVFQRRE